MRIRPSGWYKPFSRACAVSVSVVQKKKWCIPDRFPRGPWSSDNITSRCVLAQSACISLAASVSRHPAKLCSGLARGACALPSRGAARRVGPPAASAERGLCCSGPHCQAPTNLTPRSFTHSHGSRPLSSARGLGAYGSGLRCAGCGSPRQPAGCYAREGDHSTRFHSTQMPVLLLCADLPGGAGCFVDK